MILIGLLLCLANIRPTEYVQFQNDVGVVILDVGRVGPQAAEFDDFVSILIDRIREARST